jgi:multidrug efflux pump subunit AcrB
MEIRAQLPPSVLQPEVKSFTIDDVPFLVFTFSSSARDDYSLRGLVAPLARELSSTPDLSKIELSGGRKKSIRVVIDPAKMSANGISLFDMGRAVQQNDASAPSGRNWSIRNVYDVEVGGRLKNASDVENIAIGLRAGRIVKIKDVASVK